MLGFTKWKIPAWSLWGFPILAAAVLLPAGYLYSGRFPAWHGPVLLTLAWPLSYCFLWFSMSFRKWRLKKAAEAAGDQEGLPGWPGAREHKGRVIVRKGSSSLRAWAIIWGFFVTFVLVLWGMDSEMLSSSGYLLATAPPIIFAMLSMAWGPSGWKLMVDSTTQNATLLRFGSFWRVREEAASLPTIQSVALADDQKGRYILTIALTRGLGWSLTLPADWPPELSRALAARLAHLAGVETPVTAGAER